MTYNEAIEYLYLKLPMFSRIGSAAYKTDLTNTLALCKIAGQPERKFKSIHVAGTNGKGSTSHMLASILQVAGYKTGLYTSPHLKDFRERIRVNGEMINQAFVADFVSRMQGAVSDIQPSFFELTVVMAFEYFALEKVDIAVIETGLGGRLDSTNIIQPEVAVITNIGYDHMNILGNSLNEIAFEKAGIIKPGIPVIIGESDSVTRHIFEAQALEKNAPIKFADEQLHAIDWKNDDQYLEVEISKDKDGEKYFYELDLNGIYQTKNLVTTLAAIHELQSKGWIIFEEHIKEGLKQVKKTTGLHGRWERIHKHPEVILDVAHNADGIKQLLRQLELIDPKHLHIVIGLVRDKDISKVLEQLPKYARYYFTQANIPRAMEVEELKEKAAAYELRGDAYRDVNLALRIAILSAKKEDLIVVCGSVFVVGEVELS